MELATEIQTEPKTIYQGINIYNQNYGVRKINILGGELEPHTGIIEVTGEKDFFKKKGIGISIMRMQFQNFNEFMFRSFYVNGKKQMYFDYMSVHQYQQNILDLPFQDLEVDADTKIELELPSKSDATFTFFGSVNDFHKSKELTERSKLCIVVENKTGTPKNINILDATKYGKEDILIDIDTPICNVGKEKFTTKLIRIISPLSKQLATTAKINDMFIETGAYFSISQFQANVVDMPFKEGLELSLGGNFEVTVLPHTKVMYCIY